MKLHFQHWLMKLPVFRNYGATTLGSHIFFREPKEKVPQKLIDHEKVHVEQIEKLGAVLFYATYLLDYLRNRLRGMDHAKAYREIRFEKEAYERVK